MGQPAPLGHLGFVSAARSQHPCLLRLTRLTASQPPGSPAVRLAAHCSAGSPSPADSPAEPRGCISQVLVEGLPEVLSLSPAPRPSIQGIPVSNSFKPLSSSCGDALADPAAHFPPPRLRGRAQARGGLADHPQHVLPRARHRRVRGVADPPQRDVSGVPGARPPPCRYLLCAVPCRRDAHCARCRPQVSALRDGRRAWGAAAASSKAFRAAIDEASTPPAPFPPLRLIALNERPRETPSPAPCPSKVAFPRPAHPLCTHRCSSARASATTSPSWNRSPPGRPVRRRRRKRTRAPRVPACSAAARRTGCRPPPPLSFLRMDTLRGVGASVESPPPPPPSRTKWTRLVHPSVLTGHVSSLSSRSAVPAHTAASPHGGAPLV